MADCVHTEFEAAVNVNRLFSTEMSEADALAVGPESLGIEVKVWCVACGKRARFEGPVGMDVGPGSAATVSVDGCELRAAAHMGENLTRRVSTRLRVIPGD